ncbi:hypothetical protein Q4Q39_00185 [Flavivirga amylovorans]|uniref:Alpha/beta hydrolase n=1 Tax=Flavivirga amylovorans TaxID=870486 RepID=A0ABT8WWD5_9FLAO|nr:hypothetical protein [Flavivirga amylovorans]MDO5985807.1 hypothetical protein [Flavivirga amylovorans]
MKQQIKPIYRIIAFLLLLTFSCNENDDANISTPPEGRVYFTVQDIEVSNSNVQSVIVELRYEGVKTNENVNIPFTITFPNNNRAVEGEDFILPKSDAFMIRKGEAITKVVLLQRVINNESATQNRSIIFELQETEGIRIGNTSNAGNSITVTIVPEPVVVIDPNDPNDFIGDKKFAFTTTGGSSFKIPYFSNRQDIRNTNNSAITRVVIVLQGANRNARSYYQSMLEAAKMESNNLDSLLIVSPQFLEEEDIISYVLDEEHLYWSSGWRLGNTSRDEPANPRPEQVSSYTIMDSLMVKLSEYPNLKKIVFTGHSAGGQFVNRYSASSPIPDLLDTKGVDICFMVNNPSSYVYLDGKRKVLGTQNTYTVPQASSIANCPEYNEYRYGLEDLPFYLREVGGVGIIRERLEKRHVIYLVGQNDNNPNGNLFDVSCEAQFQGRDRFERAHNYFDYLIDFYGESIKNNQKLHVVPGVGHNSAGMFQSEAGRKYAFRE